VGHKKHQSVQPFGYEIKESVRKKHRLWTRYIETRNPTVLHKHRKMRNKVKNEVNKIHQFKQESIARLTKSNPKHFWKYIKSKSSIVQWLGVELCKRCLQASKIHFCIHKM